MIKLHANLYDYQKEGVAFALENPYHLNGFEMGLGKTVTALAVAVAVKLPTLVICPAFLRLNWRDEIAKFTEGLDIDVIGYSELKSFVPKKNYGTVIGDECHYLKNIKAKRTEYFHELITSMMPKNLMLMSGTPLKNRIPEFYSLLQLCYYGGQYPAFKRFYNRPYSFYNTFSNAKTFRINGVTGTRYEGMKNVDHLKAMIKPIYIRKKAKDVLDLPPVVRKEVVLNNKNKHSKRMLDAWEAYNDGEINPHLMSEKAVNALAKVKDTVALAQDIIDQGHKVVIFTDHVDAAHAIAKELKGFAITGAMSADDRAMKVKLFNELKDAQAIVATIGSLSVGVNLTSSNYMIFNDLPWIPSDLAQAEKRIHRIGQEKTCFYYYLFNSEMDKQIFDIILKKTEVLKEF